MGRRFLIALLSIFITGLKFIVNMLTIGISFLTKKNIPMVEDWIPTNKDSEKQESIKRSHYIVDNNEYNTQVEMSEYNSKIEEARDLLD